jgi:glycosyltransferase involved in cell wall biosynthesis
MPNVILEGMASGLAIIATDVGAVSVAVNRDNGWLVEPRDAGQLLAALREACHANLEPRRRNALRDVRERFLWPEIGKRTETLIAEIVAAKK